MTRDRKVTKILFIDNDEDSFEIRQCVARVLGELPPIQLFHANDASEGLLMLEDLQPDVVVIDEDVSDELSLFIDSLSPNHPPIVLRTAEDDLQQLNSGQQITCIPKNESLEGLHQTLVVAASLASKGLPEEAGRFLH